MSVVTRHFAGLQHNAILGYSSTAVPAPRNNFICNFVVCCGLYVSDIYVVE